ncbi:MAG: hypothetical protein DI570_11815 [Phenylobacterium zucineum]|nr:MAG: hypothetical protein DI570_11815 [Phenylobacterium zucineum]
MASPNPEVAPVTRAIRPSAHCSLITISCSARRLDRGSAKSRPAAASPPVDLAARGRSVPAMPAAVLYMDAEIRPNRSLSRRGFIILIGVVTAANVAAATVFLLNKATFVPVFMGLDVAALAVAFWASYRSGRIVERVRVSPAEITVSVETPKGVKPLWSSATAFTRVTRLCDEEDRVVALGLALSGRQIHVAASLSPGERREFGRALEAAILQARRHRD